MQRRARWVGAVAISLALGGCASTGEQAPLVAATEFQAHLRASQPEAACALLSPSARAELEASAGKECAQALPEEHLPADSRRLESSRFGSMAQVRFADETIFLSRFPDGWLIVGAGCTPTTSGVYDCRIKGR